MLRQAFSKSTRVLGATGALLAAAELTTHIPSQGRSSDVYHCFTDQVVTPLIRNTFDPETAHDLAVGWAMLGPRYRTSSSDDAETKINVTQELWKGRIVGNPIGLAAGFDKDGKAIESMLNTGFGFVEIGSVTLQPQPGNPSPRMFRLIEDQAIINRYGFNSCGADKVLEHLKAYRQKQKAMEQGKLSLWQQIFGTSPVGGLVGVNLGKNKTSNTPLEDYQALIQKLGPYADYLVINVSSPNTPGLRDLQASDSLEYLLKGCLEARNQLVATSKKRTTTLPTVLPLLVKLSPDLSETELSEICQVLLKVKVDGIILTNTTVARPDSLQSANKKETGGLSGRPLASRSTECIHAVYRMTNGRIPIIGVGGIFTAQDVYEKIKAGASAVQVYSGMVYRGPGMVSKLRHELADMVLKDGYSDIQQVIGLDHRSKHTAYLKKGNPKR